MNRRSNESNGFIKFPINDITDYGYQCSGEGGIAVRLVVMNNSREGESTPSWPICCVSLPNIIENEVTLGCDAHFQLNDMGNNYQRQQHYQKSHYFEESHISKHNEKYLESQIRVSVEYLAVITLATTGWSGYSDLAGYWKAQYSDLTEEGKELYALIQKLYPGKIICIETLLDT